MARERERGKCYTAPRILSSSGGKCDLRRAPAEIRYRFFNQIANKARRLVG